jgi:hypothetical protein
LPHCCNAKNLILPKAPDLSNRPAQAGGAWRGGGAARNGQSSYNAGFCDAICAFAF